MTATPRTLALCVAALAAAAPARADDQCHVVDVSFIPADELQIAVWVEKADGTFVDTIYLTRKTATFGLGNRPGRYDFNSGPPSHELWPYGRRSNVLPVWAHRQPLTWPQIDFQDGNDDGLSHMFSQSSPEKDPPYCRPMKSGDPGWDTGSCATPMVFTDKGVFAPDGAVSHYPPRADLTPTMGLDSASVAQYRQMNPFQSISTATPPAGGCAKIAWPIPPELAAGDYVMWVEVSKSFDYNSTYNMTTLPPPEVDFASYGVPVRGQPSVVYSVPFTIGQSESTASTQAYAGYGDEDGSTGTLHPPDATISTDTPASGALRLELIPGTSDRVEVDVKPEDDTVAPAGAQNISATTIAATSATVQFIAPGDDGTTGSVSGYTIMIRAGEPITPDNFASSTPVTGAVTPGTQAGNCGTIAGYPPAGTVQSVDLTGLLPLTQYWIGIQAYDKCHNVGPISVGQFITPDVQPGEVNACFVATAAYGSRMANDVELLRRFRDQLLERSVLGELAVETYYTFSPPVAGVIGSSDVLREGARDLLAPIVARVKRLRW
ncbi:MAG TPA: CFI-box-CTERM domain-containing protein [Kofleriaceae bacterium]|nr:CFI-box-CTERM domain-containing protein [Kofleriaceae bacterium]